MFQSFDLHALGWNLGRLIVTSIHDGQNLEFVMCDDISLLNVWLSND